MLLTGFKNIAQLLDHFKDRSTCIEYLEQQRWPDGKITCIHCGHEKVYRTKTGFRCAGKGCCKKFSVLVGSLYENTKIPIRLWFGAMYLATTHKKGISSMQLATDLGICQKSAWHMMHRIREAMYDADGETQLKGTVQSDESYFGGLNKNRHADKQYENSQGRSTNGKTPVVGLIEVGGKVRTFVVNDTDSHTLHSLIDLHVDKDATIVTDAHGSYNGLGEKLNHIVVKHKQGSYITERDGNKFHTQNIENYWSVFKRGYVGIYHYMSPKHLHRYCKEFTYRYNNRNLTPKERFELAVKQCSGKRLTFKKLTEPTAIEQKPKIRKKKTTAQLIDMVNDAITMPYSDWTIGMSPEKKLKTWRNDDDSILVFNPHSKTAVMEAYMHFAELGMECTGEVFDEPWLLFVLRNV